jgi:undecaprenyl-diphosphatase
VSGQLPWASLPLNLLASAVAYSRVHTGVHYPADTIIGASIGTASAALTTRLANRVMRRRHSARPAA